MPISNSTTGKNSSSITPPDPIDSLHPFPSGHIFHSPGGHFTYRVMGPCCRLFDRDELPWPCCRIQWRSKEPSWRRIGKRFIADIAARNAPSYSVEILGQEPSRNSFVMTLYWSKLSPPLKNWWYSKKPPDDWTW
ncbi:MAG: hypothetical protein ACFE0J_18825 [Elainellaceae cyanobacterium]